MRGAGPGRGDAVERGGGPGGDGREVENDDEVDGDDPGVDGDEGGLGVWKSVSETDEGEEGSEEEEEAGWKVCEFFDWYRGEE